MIESAEDLSITGSASSLEELREVLGSETPDVVLADVPTGSGIGLRQMLRQVPAAVTLMDGRDDSAVQDALELGSRGVLTRDAETGEILAALEAAASGLVVLDWAHSLAFTGSPTVDLTDRRGEVEVLTPREIEVLGMLAEGIGNKMIARRLAISEHTVKFHVGSILSKLGAESRTEAVTIGVREGLITV